MKGAIFLDVDNLVMNGGWGMQYEVVRNLAEAQGVTIIRANAYLRLDEEAEKDPIVRRKREGYRDLARKAGFHMALKPVKKFVQPDGTVHMKSNSDLDIAVDALLQSESLDYVLLGTGDGDFLKVVRALQSKGKRVDLLAFNNVSTELRHEADYFFSGFLMPGVLPSEQANPGLHTGFIHFVDEAKGYGFVTMYTGLKNTDYRDDIFIHKSNVKDKNGYPVSSTGLVHLKNKVATLEFEFAETERGFEARKAKEIDH